MERVIRIVLKALAGVVAVLLLFLVGFYSTGAFNRLRYAERTQDRTVSRPPNRFYVRPSGSDTNSGTSLDRAWKTIAKVNRESLVPGDSILFEGGQQFPGNLVFGSDDLGTPAKPIHVGSFGSGRATILAESGNAILIHNGGGYEIESLKVAGSKQAENGIMLYNDLLGGVKIPYVRIDSVEASGFHKFGICVAGNFWKSGFRDVRITRVSAHDNALAGIYVYGGYRPGRNDHAHRDIYVGDSTAYNNSGLDGSERENSGSGIVFSDVDSGTIERSTAFHNGYLSNSRIGGPVGIWAWDSDSITIQFNRSYDNRSNGPKDGGGFDLDGGVTNSVLQYNYSSGNDGAGYLICTFPHGRLTVRNIVRYNVSLDDGRKNGYGAVHLFGDVEESEVYNNTLIVDPSGAGSPVPVRIESGSKDAHFRNNVFYASQGLSILRIDPMQQRLVFQGNAYISAGPDLELEWQDAKFKTLSEWRASTGEETLASRNLGIEAHSSSDHSTSTEDFESVAAQFRSILTDAGLDLRALFGLDPGKRDYYGTSVPSGSAFDIGAQEWPTAPPSHKKRGAVLDN
jgi:hypothetical protein